MHIELEIIASSCLHLDYHGARLFGAEEALMDFQAAF
jgi:hypothetical protein